VPGVTQDLETLDLTGNVIADEGAVALSKGFGCLRQLRLRQNPITTAGALALVKSANNVPSLRIVDVAGATFSDEEKTTVTAAKAATACYKLFV